MNFEQILRIRIFSVILSCLVGLVFPCENLLFAVNSWVDSTNTVIRTMDETNDELEEERNNLFADPINEYIFDEGGNIPLDEGSGDLIGLPTNIVHEQKTEDGVQEFIEPTQVVEEPVARDLSQNEQPEGETGPGKSESLLDMVGPSGNRILGSKNSSEPEELRKATIPVNYLEMIGPTGRKIGEVGSIGTKNNLSIEKAAPFSLAGLIGPSGKEIGVVGVQERGPTDSVTEITSLLQEREVRGTFRNFLVARRFEFDSMADEKELYDERGVYKLHTNLYKRERAGSITINIKKGTVFLGEKNSAVTQQITSPREVDLLPQLPWGAPLRGVKYGLDNEQVAIKNQYGDKETIEISLQLTNQNLSVGDTVVIYSSQDGVTWSYHSSSSVAQDEGELRVFFETDHLTYFYVSSMAGNYFINNDDNVTNNLAVTLTMNLTGVTQMRFGNTEVERDAAIREPFVGTRAWTLSAGEGVKTVYASFQNASGDILSVLDDIIYLQDAVVPNNLDLRYDSADATNVATGVSATPGLIDVITLVDKSNGAGSNATQGSSLLRPKYVFDGAANQYITQFDGSDDYLYIETKRLRGRLRGLTLCTTFKTTATGPNIALFDFDDSEHFSIYLNGGNIGFDYHSAGTVYQNLTSGLSLNDGNMHVACLRFDGTAVNDTTIVVDGLYEYDANIVGNNSRIGNNGTTRYGFLGDGSEATTENGTRKNSYFSGAIGEILYYEKTRTNAEIDENMCYLGNKRGVLIPACSANVGPIAKVTYDYELPTTQPITAILTGYSEAITITNNGGSNTYLFTGNGTFTFEFEDIDGNTGATLAKVDRKLPGELSLTAGSGLVLTGLVTENFEQEIVSQFDDYFTVTDTIGVDNGYYTTLQLEVLTGNNDVLSNLFVEWYATGVDLVSGSANSNVVLATGFQSYAVASGPIVFLKRDQGVNNYVQGVYGAKPIIRLTIPPYTTPDTYQGVITYTLYEN